MTNRLSYKIIEDENTGTVFEAVLDEKGTFFKIDVAALDISRLQGGVCPILFCNGCDMIGCAGYYADVSITETNIVWNFFYERFYEPESPNEYKTDVACVFSDYQDKEKNFIVHAPLTFNKAEYNALADKLMALLSEYPQEKEEYERAIKSYESGDRFRG